jgi:WD40 repeat protein
MSVSQYQQRILSVLIRVVSISLCSENGNILSGSLDRTVLLWDSRVEKAQVHFSSISLLFDCLTTFPSIWQPAVYSQLRLLQI